MNINNFRGDLTDVSAKKEPLMTTILRNLSHLTWKRPCFRWFERGVTNVTNTHACIMHLLIDQCIIWYLVVWLAQTIWVMPCPGCLEVSQQGPLNSH